MTLEGYIRIDVENATILEVNEAFCRIAGMSPEGWTGGPVPDFLKGILDHARTFREPIAWTKEGELSNASGVTTAFLVNCSIDIDDTGRRQVIAFLTDISLRKFAEKMLEERVRCFDSSWIRSRPGFSGKITTRFIVAATRHS